jgi:hypothetical protein
LRETLSTISSPTFSEFTLKLEGCPRGHFRLLSSQVVWGDEWGLIDRDLSEMVHTTGRDIRIRLIVRLGMNGVWSPALGGFMRDAFPLMKARRLVEVG